MRIDTFYTIEYKKCYIHHKCVNGISVYTAQIYESKYCKPGEYFTKEFKTEIGAKRFITNWVKNWK